MANPMSNQYGFQPGYPGYGQYPHGPNYTYNNYSAQTSPGYAQNYNSHQKYGQNFHGPQAYSPHTQYPHGNYGTPKTHRPNTRGGGRPFVRNHAPQHNQYERFNHQFPGQPAQHPSYGQQPYPTPSPVPPQAVQGWNTGHGGWQPTSPPFYNQQQAISPPSSQYMQPAQPNFSPPPPPDYPPVQASYDPHQPQAHVPGQSRHNVWRASGTNQRRSRPVPVSASSLQWRRPKTPPDSIADDESHDAGDKTNHNPHPDLDWFWGDDTKEWYGPPHLEQPFCLGTVIWRAGKYISRALPCNFAESEKMLSEHPPSLTPQQLASESADFVNLGQPLRPVSEMSYFREVQDDPVFRDLSHEGKWTRVESYAKTWRDRQVTEPEPSTQYLDFNADFVSLLDRSKDVGDEDDAYSPPPAATIATQSPLAADSAEYPDVLHSSQSQSDNTSRQFLSTTVSHKRKFSQLETIAEEVVPPKTARLGNDGSASTSDNRANLVQTKKLENNALKQEANLTPDSDLRGGDTSEDVQARIDAIASQSVALDARIDAHIEAVTRVPQMAAEHEKAEKADVQAMIDAITGSNQVKHGPSNHNCPQSPEIRHQRSTSETSMTRKRTQSLPKQPAEFPKDSVQEDVLAKLGVTGAAKPVFTMPPPARADPPPGYERSSQSRSRSASPVKHVLSSGQGNPIHGLPIPPPPPPPPPPPREVNAMESDALGRPSSSTSQRTAAGSDFHDDVEMATVGISQTLETIAEDNTLSRKRGRSTSNEIDDIEAERLQKRPPKIPDAYQRRW